MWISARDVTLPDGLVVALRPLAANAPWVEAWRNLSRRPLLDNLFYDPDFALPAARAFGRDVQMALVGDRAPEEPGLRLLSAWPVRTTRGRWGVPLTLAIGWRHAFGVFGAPLLDADEPARALDALFSGLRRLVGPRLMLTHVPTNGPFAELLSAWLDRNRLRHARFWVHERAFLDLTDTGAVERADYLGHLSSRRQRRLRHAWDSLDAEAAVTVESIRAPADLPDAIDDYIALEAAGWKGRRGTAIASDPSQALMMREAVFAMGARGEVRIDRLRRGGRTLAATVNFVTRGQIWILKISYDGAVARHSPGALLFHRLTLDLLADPAIATADSCAPPNYPLPESFWKQRLALAHILVETAGGDPLFPLAVWLERVRTAANVGVRAWRDRFRAWRDARSAGGEPRTGA